MINMDPAASFLVNALTQQLLGLLVMVGGIIYAASSSWRCPAAAKLVISALILMLITTLVSTATSAVLISLISTQKLDASEYQTISTLLSLASGGLRAVGLGMLIAAAFVRRETVYDERQND